MIRVLSWGEGSRGCDGEASRDVRGVEGGTARLLEGVGLDPLGPALSRKKRKGVVRKGIVILNEAE